MMNETMIEGLTPLVCIFCRFKTCIEFDLDLHLYEDHRSELLKLPIYGSFDSRIESAVNQGRRVGISTSTTLYPHKQPEPEHNQKAPGILKAPEPSPISSIDKTPITRTPPASWMSIISVKDFFDNSTLPLRHHSLEQSPIFPLIDSKLAGKCVLYYCKLHPKTVSIHLSALEHHCLYCQPDMHEAEVIAWMRIQNQVKVQVSA